MTAKLLAFTRRFITRTPVVPAVSLDPDGPGLTLRLDRQTGTEDVRPDFRVPAAVDAELPQTRD